jgi:ribosomal protein S18 acetylase RimI-like enzyme
MVFQMRIVPLDSNVEPLFWQHVYSDIPDYYFFILDLKYDRINGKVTMALDEQNQIEGMMLVYHDFMAQLRGNEEAVRALLVQLDLDKSMITAPKECGPLTLPRKYEVKNDDIRELTVMALRKGEETPQIKHQLIKLSTTDSEEIAALMRAYNFDWWGEINAEQIAERMKERLWLGVRVDGKLVSIGGARIDDWASNINTVATHEEFRNKGYATSIVSALVEQIMRKSNLALIHVESKNLPAMHAYLKAGFKPYKNYIVAKVEKRQNKGGEITKE